MTNVVPAPPTDPPNTRDGSRNRVSKTECNADGIHSMLNVNSKSVCAICNECLFDATHDKCVLDYVHGVTVLSKSKPAKRKNKKQIWKPTGKVYNELGYKWKPTGRTFTIVRHKCPLTRFTSTKVVPLKETTIKSIITPTPRIKVVQIVLWYLDSEYSKHMTGNRSQLTNFVNKFLGIVKFGNDQIAKIMGYGDYQIGNVTISRKDEAPEFIIKFLKMIQVYLNATVRNIRTYNDTKFVNQTLRSYYEDVEAVATACYTQNSSLIRLCYKKTPYELLHDRKPDLSYLYVFGALCYLTNDSGDLGKLKAKADAGIFIGYAP
ncbi:retrovirus-related pol polyprotein from transposon TNT 1-94 [Tanacetum coccineum]|uniref:Retrovirus-related pol polyprotein from transposon TNT 1-94 n=1 Tax=Tanacetum coccineum TaxID=301880 RepID=A0ABQ5CA94_9ASTR